MLLLNGLLSIFFARHVAFRLLDRVETGFFSASAKSSNNRGRLIWESLEGGCKKIGKQLPLKYLLKCY